jgi:glycosyltransferase involved in cell wall biosynthesis
VVPDHWKEPVLKELRPHVDNNAPYRLQPLPCWFAGNEMRFLYRSRTLGLKAPTDILVVENGPGAFSYTQFLLAKRRYAPTAKAVFFTWWNLPYRARQPLRALEQWNLRQSNGAIAGNQAAADILRQQGFSGPILVLPQLGIDEQVFCPQSSAPIRASMGIPDNHFVVGYAGRFVPEKGLDLLWQAFCALPAAATLLLIGDGPQAEVIRRWQENAPLGKQVVLHRAVPHTEIARLFNALDVFVLPSRSTPFWLEQFGHVLIEAMACQIAVVGSSSAEIPNVIGAAGGIFPEGESLALQHILTLLQQHPEQRANWAAAGRKRVLAHYTHAQIARQTVAFLQTLA